MKTTAAHYMQGDGLPKGVFLSPTEVVTAMFGNLENWIGFERAKYSLIEAYQSAKDKPAEWNAIRRFYEFIQPEIDQARFDRWVFDYEVGFDRRFTPIEKDVWDCLRIYSVVAYPQYPVLNYFLDFANPKLKIAIEADGKQWHDAAKDAARDERLASLGWKVFRLTGAECRRCWQSPEDVEQDDSLSDEEQRRSIRRWYCETAEGLVSALHYRYFAERDVDAHRHGDFMQETLSRHCERYEP